MASFQGIFRRGQKYVAVRYIRLSSTTRIEPGTELPSKKYPLKAFHVRSLFMRRRIGHKDSPWTKSMLANLKDTRALPELQKEPEPEIETNEDIVVTEPETTTTVSEGPELIVAEPEKVEEVKAEEPIQEQEIKEEVKTEKKEDKAKEAPKPKSKAKAKSKEKATSKAKPEADAKPQTNGETKEQPWLAK